jgi:hypothetical protein
MDLQRRMVIAVKDAGVDTQLLDKLRVVFEMQLAKQHIVLSSAEIERLYRQVARSVLSDLIAGLDSPSLPPPSKTA